MNFKILFIILSLSYSQAFSQFINDEEPEYNTTDSTQGSWFDNVFFGGSFGMLFGDVTYINISPTMGYQVNPYYAVGGGIIYEYMSDKRFSGYEYNTSMYGGKVFIQSVLFDYVILFAEENILSLERKYFDAIHNHPEEGRFLMQIPRIGAGFYQRSSGSAGMYFLFLVNLNYSINSPYGPYEYRIGFNF